MCVVVQIMSQFVTLVSTLWHSKFSNFFGINLPFQFVSRHYQKILNQSSKSLYFINWYGHLKYTVVAKTNTHKALRIFEFCIPCILIL
jgi:hypothetical protein